MVGTRHGNGGVDLGLRVSGGDGRHWVGPAVLLDCRYGRGDTRTELSHWSGLAVLPGCRGRRSFVDGSAVGVVTRTGLTQVEGDVTDVDGTGTHSVGVDPARY